jgi:hypothetical protein
VRSRAGSDLARDAAARVLEPAVGRVRTLVEAAERAPRDGPQEAARATLLLEQTAADRELVDALLDDTDPLRAGLVDRVAEQICGDVVAFYNETADGDTATRLLQQTRALRPSSAAQARIDQNVETIRDNAEWARCWFCRAERGDEDKGFEVALHGNVQRDYLYGRATWQTTTLRVPRCSTCAALHARWSGTGCVVGLVVSLVIALVVAGVVVGSELPAGWAVVIWAALTVGTAVLLESLSGRGARLRAREFPPLQEKLASGWALGARPPGTQ